MLKMGVVGVFLVTFIVATLAKSIPVSSINIPLFRINHTRVKKMRKPVKQVRGTQSNYVRNHIGFKVLNLAFLVF